jgi:hypothetical protein
MKKTSLSLAVLLAGTVVAFAQKEPLPLPPPPPPTCQYGTITSTTCVTDTAMCNSVNWSQKYPNTPCPYQACTTTTMCAPAPSSPPPPTK